jgi:hypothetical protein
LTRSLAKFAQSQRADIKIREKVTKRKSEQVVLRLAHDPITTHHNILTQNTMWEGVRTTPRSVLCAEGTSSSVLVFASPSPFDLFVGCVGCVLDSRVEVDVMAMEAGQ